MNLLYKQSKLELLYFFQLVVNHNKNISIQARTEYFAIRVIKAYCELNKRHFDDAGKVLSKQFLRSGTSIGANCSEAKYAQSNKDFINKYSLL